MFTGENVTYLLYFLVLERALNDAALAMRRCSGCLRYCCGSADWRPEDKDKMSRGEGDQNAITSTIGSDDSEIGHEQAVDTSQ